MCGGTKEMEILLASLTKTCAKEQSQHIQHFDRTPARATPHPTISPLYERVLDLALSRCPSPGVFPSPRVTPPPPPRLSPVPGKSSNRTSSHSVTTSSFARAAPRRRRAGTVGGKLRRVAVDDPRAPPRRIGVHPGSRPRCVVASGGPVHA